MGPETNRNQLLGEIQTFASQCVEPSPLGLMTSPPAFDFAYLEPELKLARQIGEILSTPDVVNRLPISQHAPIRDAIRDLAETLKSMRNFDPAKPDASNSRLHPTQTRNDLADKLIQAVSGILTQHPYVISISTDFSEFTAGAARRLKDIDGAETAALVKLKEIEAIADAARTAASQTAVSRHRGKFSEEAATTDQTARKWLYVTIGFAAVTVIVALGLAVGPAVLSFNYPDSTYTRYVLDPASVVQVQLMTSKAVILVVLLLGTLWCGRIYKVLRHQATINRHRALALETFDAFTQSTSDPAIRDVVLTEATRTIFGVTSPGFIDGGDGTQDANLKLFEIVRTLGSSKGQQ